MPSLAAEGLALELQTALHAEAMFTVLSDPAIYTHENEAPPSVEWLRERFLKLESRHSPDGTERWLNWVVGLPSGELIGYVQATVRGDHAVIAYALASRHWGHGYAQRAVRAMLHELRHRYGVRVATAVLKNGNQRSRRLLGRLGFTEAERDPRRHAENETFMHRPLVALA